MTPLYITGINPEGKFLLGGVFRMKDQEGFPLDCSYDICKEHDIAIDYCELLCDAWFHDCLGFETVVKQLDMLCGSHEHEWCVAGTLFLETHPKALKQEFPINVFCKYILAKKRLASKAFMAWATFLIKVSAVLTSRKHAT